LPPQVQQLLEQALEELTQNRPTEEWRNNSECAKDKISENASEKTSHKKQGNINLSQDN